MRIIFMGTPDFAVPTLREIVNQGHRVITVVTQPDRVKGRGFKLSYSPVKECALGFNIPVEQPVKLKKDYELIEKLKQMEPDAIVVVAFGQLLPREVLSIPKLGCINVHASLLPKYRGAAPINWSIINGESKTGVTTMLMDKGLDTGDILLKKSVDIEEDETAGELHDRLQYLGAQLLIETLDGLEKGSLNPEPQDNSKSSYASMLDKDMGKISWVKNAKDIKNLVRGLNPWPGAYSYLNDSKLKIWRTEIEKDVKGQPGEIWKVDKAGIHVYAGCDGIIIKELQGENAKRIDAYAYTLGHPVKQKSIFE